MDQNADRDAHIRSDKKPIANLERRHFLASAGSLAAAATVAIPSQLSGVPTAETGAVNQPRSPGDPAAGGYGIRSQFEREMRMAAPAPNEFAAVSLTPLVSMVGNITPAGLHFERHHAGIPKINPEKHWLFVHGQVRTAKKFSIADLRRFPSITRRYVIECSGNTSSEWRRPTQKGVQWTHGLLSTSEWTGVAFSSIAREVGIVDDANWVLAEGADACLMTRSIPLEKLLSDGLLAYGQNGEAIRPEQGYPLRLIVPGYEGNVHIKWLQRLQFSNQPFMTREETSKYTDLMADGRARQFTFVMDAKSVITNPSPGMQLSEAGFYPISGLAWTGRGKIASVEVSLDGGHSWQQAQLDSAPESMSSVRFSLPWQWRGEKAVLQSRCTDETGYQQPTLRELIRQRPSNGPTMSGYHNNAIQSWAIAADGKVSNIHV